MLLSKYAIARLLQIVDVCQTYAYIIKLLAAVEVILVAVEVVLVATEVVLVVTEVFLVVAEVVVRVRLPTVISPSGSRGKRLVIQTMRTMPF